jgi:hypothetical protein
MKPRKRGSAPDDIKRLKRWYEEALEAEAKKRKEQERHKQIAREVPSPVTDDPFSAATAGDPLVAKDRDRALKAYGITDAPRPTVRLRQIGAEVWGGVLDQMAAEAREIQAQTLCSNSKAAGEVLVRYARKRFFLGVGAPASFNDAVKQLREALAKGERKHHRVGWTGEYLHVRPADGLVVRNPEDMPAPLPIDGAVVPDDLYWRRLLRDGDVILIEKRATIA